MKSPPVIRTGKSQLGAVELGEVSLCIDRSTGVDRVLIRHPSQDLLGIDTVRCVERHDMRLRGRNSLQTVHVVGNQGVLDRTDARRQEEVPGRLGSLGLRQESGVSVQPRLVARISECTEDGLLFRVRVGE